MNAPERTIPQLTDDQKQKIRRDYFTHGVATCPIDGFPLRVEDTTTFGMQGRSIMVSCPECGGFEGELKPKSAG
jgi:hypothetical protein